MNSLTSLFNRINSVKLFSLGLLLTGIFACSAIIAPTAHAAYDDLDTYLHLDYDQYISRNPNNPVTGRGNYTPEFQFLLYSEVSSRAPYVDIQRGAVDASPKCEDFQVYQATPTNDNRPSNNGTTIVDSIRTWNGSSGIGCNEGAVTNGFRINLLGSRWSPSERFGGSYVVTAVRIVLRSSAPSRFADVEVRDTSGNDKLSYIGDQTGDSDTNSRVETGVSYSRTTSGYGTIRARFAPSCNYSSSSPATIWWKDADSGTYPDEPGPNGGKTVTVRLYENGTLIRTKDGRQGGQRFSMTFNPKAGAKYRLDFENVRGRNESAGISANTVKVWYPFDSASYYQICTTANGWNVVWSSNYILRNDNRNMGEVTGDISQPDNGDAPQPGQNFRYINDARNAGSREVTNAYWYCPATANTFPGRDPGDRGNCYRSPFGNYTHVHGTVTHHHNPNDRDWELISNTQTIAFDRGRTGLPDDTFANLGTGTPKGDLLVNNPSGGWVWDTFNVNADDGGRTRCVNASFWPDHGVGYQGNYALSPTANTINGTTRTTRWTIPGPESRVYAPQLCVNVPHYYNLQQLVTVGGRDGVTVQQGTNLQITGTVSQPSATGSRNHTNSQPGKEKGVLQFRLDPGEAEPSVKTGQGPIPTSPLDWCNGRSSGLATCTKVLTDARIVNAGGGIKIPDDPDNIYDVSTGNLPVGTKLCYATYSNHPRHIDGDDYNNGDGRWSYSSIECATVVKSPKVHFLNTDVTVGRYRTTATDCQPAVNAPIITTGTPESKRASNLYGSWVEYGAFATGNITSFGSGAAPFDSNFESTRLTFGNTPSDLGEFIYGKNCLADPFGIVKDDNNTDLAGSSAFDQATGILSMDGLSRSGDKTGYVSTNDNIHIGPPTAATPSTPTPVPPTSNVPYTITVRAGAEIYPAGGCPAMHIRLTDLSGAVKNFNQNVCQSLQSGAGWNNWRNYSFNTTIDGGGVATLEVLYNPPDAWGGTSATDRNLYVHSIAVRNNATSTTTDVNTNRSTPNLRLILPRGAPRGPEQTVRPTDPSPSNNCFVNNTSPAYTQTNDRIALFQSIENAVPAAASVTAGNAWCAGFRVTNIEEPPLPPPPPSVSLSSSYTGFNGRNIVIYSKKTSGGNCSATSDGNITINQDILFKKDGFTSVLDVPRIILMADCNITIADNVVEVNASLIAGDAIRTCSIRVELHDKCDRALTIRGGISANRLLLWRTHGADLTKAGAEIPAETFDLSPSQVITGYNRGLRSAKPTTVYEVDLPPRY